MLGVFQILTKTMRLLEQQHSDGEGVSLLGVRFLRRFHNLDRQQAYHFEKLTSAFSDRTWVSGLSNSNKLIRRFLGGLDGIYFIPSEQRRIGVYTVNLLEGKERASVCHQESPL